MDEWIEKLKKMKFSGMAEELASQEEDPNIDLVSSSVRIEKLINAEWELRQTKKINRLLKKACLRYPDASFDETIYDERRHLDANMIERLSQCDWIVEGKNLIITGLTGGGKTYCANALGTCAIQKYYTVYYVKVNLLLQDLVNAEAEHTLLQRLKELEKIDLLILDDFGLMDLDLNMSRNLFELIDIREGRKSTIIISQYPVSAWYDMFNENTFAEACLDRITSKAYLLDFQGMNMRNPT